MKFRGKLAFLTATVAVLGCGTANAQTKVTVDPGKKYQVFEPLLVGCSCRQVERSKLPQVG